MESPWYRVSVKATVIDEQGRFLLTREDNGYWELLGGGLEYGEEPHEALVRELQEEAGLEVTWVSERPLCVITSKRFNPETQQEKEGRVANVVYEVKVKNYDITPSEECVELRFFTLDEARNLPQFPNVTSLLKTLENSTLLQKA